MKKLIIIILIIINPLSDLHSQKRGNAASSIGGAIVGGIAAGITYNALRKSLEENFENRATEWVLSNDTITDFKLSIIRFNAVKDEDFQNVTAVPFIVMPKDIENSYIILFVLSRGWQNQFGIDFTKVKPIIMNREYWGRLMKAYLNICGHFPINDINNIQTYLPIPANFEISEDDKNSGKFLYINKYSSNGQISLQRLRKTDYKMSISSLIDIEDDNFRFYEKLEGNKSETGIYPLKNDRGQDMHLIIDFDDTLKIDYNEDDLNLFVKETRDLFKLKRKVLIDITKKLFASER